MAEHGAAVCRDIGRRQPRTAAARDQPGRDAVVSAIAAGMRTMRREAEYHNGCAYEIARDPRKQDGIFSMPCSGRLAFRV